MCKASGGFRARSSEISFAFVVRSVESELCFALGAVVPSVNTKQERKASPSVPGGIFIAPDTEITVDPSGKTSPFSVLGKGQLSHSLTTEHGAAALLWFQYFVLHLLPFWRGVCLSVHVQLSSLVGGGWDGCTTVSSCSFVVGSKAALQAGSFPCKDGRENLMTVARCLLLVLTSFIFLFLKAFILAESVTSMELCW